MTSWSCSSLNSKQLTFPFRINSNWFPHALWFIVIYCRGSKKTPWSLHQPLRKLETSGSSQLSRKLQLACNRGRRLRIGKVRNQPKKIKLGSQEQSCGKEINHSKAQMVDMCDMILIYFDSRLSSAIAAPFAGSNLATSWPLQSWGYNKMTQEQASWGWTWWKNKTSGVSWDLCHFRAGLALRCLRTQKDSETPGPWWEATRSVQLWCSRSRDWQRGNAKLRDE